MSKTGKRNCLEIIFEFVTKPIELYDERESYLENFKDDL